MDELNATGVLKLEVNGQEIELTKEDLLIDMAQMEGYVSVSDYGITVVLDTNLTPKNFWKKDLYVRSSVRSRLCVKKLISK